MADLWIRKVIILIKPLYNGVRHRKNSGYPYLQQGQIETPYAPLPPHLLI